MGRFQPFHLGHQAIINEIMLDGRIPIIVYGSSNDDRDLVKNPLTAKQRMYLVDSIYPDELFIHVASNDFTNWTLWYDQMMKAVTSKYIYFTNFKKARVYLQKDVVIYHTNKEVDRTDFWYNGKQYVNTWYTDIFKDNGFELKHSSFNEHPDLQINANARDIRQDLEANKHLLDARVFHRLKSLGWK